MFPYQTHLYLHFGNFTIESFRVMAYLATLAGSILVFSEAKRKKLSFKYTAFVLISAIIGMIAGARFFYYFGPWTWNTNTSLYTRFIEFLNIQTSGLVYYGGLLGGIATVIICAKIFKLNYWKYLDAFAPGVAIAYFIARIGCYLGGCCFGKVTNVPWAIIRNGTPIHPTQIYMSINGLVMFFFILYLNKKKREDGFVVCAAALYYSITRFIIEFYRFNNYYFLNLSSSQWLSIGLFIVSLTILIKKYNFLDATIKPMLRNAWKSFSK